MILWLIPGIVIILDQWSKWLAVRHLNSFQGITIIDSFFQLILVKNYGVAFGLFSETRQSWKISLLIFVSVGIVALLGWKYLSRLSKKNSAVKWGVTMIMGGASGNIIDRIFRGYVVDFLDFYIGSFHWPTFNIADSCITLGIGIMIVNMILEDRRRSCILI